MGAHFKQILIHYYGIALNVTQQDKGIRSWEPGVEYLGFNPYSAACDGAPGVGKAWGFVDWVLLARGDILA